MSQASRLQSVGRSTVAALILGMATLGGSVLIAAPAARAQACQEDAMMCPDGSSVVRSGPDCAFPACPGEDRSGGQVRACTEEAKVCPDGSSVGRTGPDCAFSPCPGDRSFESGAIDSDDPRSDGGFVCTQDAKVCPDGSSVSRGGPNCEFAPCPGMWN